MVKIKIKAQCPNKTSLKNFIKLLKSVKLAEMVSKNLPIKKSVITFLKSPHVNKTAQRQVEYRTFQKSMTFNTAKPFKFYFFLKKVSEHLFFDVTIVSLNIFFSKKKVTLKKKSFFLSSVKNKLKILDLKGEKMLVNFSKNLHL